MCYFFVSFAVVALGAAGLQVVKVMAAAVHDWCDVVYCVCWFVAVVACGFALQDDCPVAFVFGVAVFFTHCYRALSRLLSFDVVDVAYRASPLCRFVKCMSSGMSSKAE